MDEHLMDIGYTLARQHYKAAVQAVFSELDSRFPGTAFDTVHHTGARAMELYLAALGLARKVWAGTLPHDKAQQVLQTQFSEFPESVCKRAFSDAYTETR
jgi:hypothetical protein